MITYYKASKAISGSLLSINFIAKPDKITENSRDKGEKAVYANFVKQTGYDEKSGNGTFKGGAKLTVKFAQHEAAGIISAIQKNTSLATVMNTKYVYHDGANYGTNITFEPNFKKTKVGDRWEATSEQNGFLFRVTKTDKNNKDSKESIGIALNWAELKLLELYLEEALVRIFDCLFSEDINRAKTINAKKATNQAEPTPEMNEDGQTDGGDDFPE